ncbi:MAG: chromate transporter [Treponema sp.]|jgi:chromate transporter|nr:chromate transporter [Treponema sp.]
MLGRLILFGEFFKIGLFSIGGGLATLPFIFQLAEGGRYAQALQSEMIPDMLAVAQSAPGAMGVNLGIYTGFRCDGIPGGVIAALGLVIPSIIIIILVARMLTVFQKSRAVQAVFSGLRPAATGLLTAAGYLAIKLSLANPGAFHWTSLFRWQECGLFIILSALIFRIKIHPIVFIAAAGVIGAVLKL